MIKLDLVSSIAGSCWSLGSSPLGLSEEGGGERGGGEGRGGGERGVGGRELFSTVSVIVPPTLSEGSLFWRSKVSVLRGGGHYNADVGHSIF